jgi:hypothetical protein
MRLSKTLVGILMMACVSPALAQTNVGQLLDSGAAKLSPGDFKQQIVGRYLEGPGRGSGFTTFSAQELIYLENGVIRGSGQVTTPGGMTSGGQFLIEGSWTIDDRDRVCQTTRAAGLSLAPRCQYWFKLADKYFFADSDSDRSALITVRTVKKM